MFFAAARLPPSIWQQIVLVLSVAVLVLVL
jgi:hypothetical protein